MNTQCIAMGINRIPMTCHWESKLNLRYVHMKSGAESGWDYSSRYACLVLQVHWWSTCLLFSLSYFVFNPWLCKHKIQLLDLKLSLESRWFVGNESLHEEEELLKVWNSILVSYHSYTFYTFIFEDKMYRTRWQMNRNKRCIDIICTVKIKHITGLLLHNTMHCKSKNNYKTNPRIIPKQIQE